MRVSLADVDPLRDAALLTQHVAAPVETAVASLTARLLQDVMSAAAAQAAAVVHVLAGLVADPSLCAWRVQGRVSLTEIGGLLEVHQLAGHPLLAQAGVEDARVLVLRVDEHGRLELVPQHRSHQPEIGRDVPAGFELAAARGAVALALPLHVFFDHLPTEHKTLGMRGGRSAQ